MRQRPPRLGDEGSFGNRPYFRGDLVIDDVLSALRLFKHTHIPIRGTGYAGWTDSPFGGRWSQPLGQWPQWPWPHAERLELSEDDVPRFLELWRLLENGATGLRFGIHRFNLSFDRRLLFDRIVDLVIAAEVLFLSEIGNEQYRGEMRYRLALRAAKFIEHTNYSEHDVFRVMRRAYDARSAIVHGGSPNDTRLPDNPSAQLHTFTDAIEELLRLGLRKALSMKEKMMRQAEDRDSLILSNFISSDNK
jgi:Apea-like HEPN